ncbi:hypothetical protein TCAL_10111 [Tigriopus californicus]|uniref:Probable oligoribonuclease n=2 Tax=Tigriopus californicus TaxID=6832 RepID=A0A553P0J3_TIGCA|nr:hypothetical protein TCAL_10111 [Tigriopus californicus]
MSKLSSLVKFSFSLRPLRSFYRHFSEPRPTGIRQKDVGTMSSSNPPVSLVQDPNQHLVWVDCEMTGLSIDRDTLLEMAVIVTDGRLEIVAQGPNIVIHQPDSVLAAMDDWCTQHHAHSGLTQAVKDSPISLKECEIQMLDFIQSHVPKGQCPLAGNSIGQDQRFLTKYMPDFMSHLHYRVVDVSTIKELAKRWYPEIAQKAPKKKVTHRALDDIMESIEELRFYRATLFK